MSGVEHKREGAHVVELSQEQREVLQLGEEGPQSLEREQEIHSRLALSWDDVSSLLENGAMMSSSSVRFISGKKEHHQVVLYGSGENYSYAKYACSGKQANLLSSQANKCFRQFQKGDVHAGIATPPAANSPGTGQD